MHKLSIDSNRIIYCMRHFTQPQCQLTLLTITPFDNWMQHQAHLLCLHSNDRYRFCEWEIRGFVFMFLFRRSVRIWIDQKFEHEYNEFMKYDLQAHFLFSLLQMIPILHSINYSCDLLKYVANLRFENFNFDSANILCVPLFDFRFKDTNL